MLVQGERQTFLRLLLSSSIVVNEKFCSSYLTFHNVESYFIFTVFKRATVFATLYLLGEYLGLQKHKMYSYNTLRELYASGILAIMSNN